MAFGFKSAAIPVVKVIVEPGVRPPQTSSPCVIIHTSNSGSVPSLFVVNLTKRVKKKKKKLQLSLFVFEISMFVKIHVFLSYFGFSISGQQHRFSPAVVHGMTPKNE